MVEEARLEPGPAGLVPASQGWFVVNVRDTEWRTRPSFGSACRFESQEQPFPDVGVNLRVLRPGEPNCYYHWETNVEHFLVLHGECVLIVNDEERPLRAWDFVHCPPETGHVFVGAGTGPSVILMIGGRSREDGGSYPVSETALRHGAGVEREVETSAEAYAGLGRGQPGRPLEWDQLPWSRISSSTAE
jgi:uncharacterized cupin superfamily protein